MAEGRRGEQWKQITWLRAGLMTKPPAELNAWNPLLADAGGGERQQTSGELHRAIGRALAKRKAAKN